jgi:transposase
MTLLPRGVKFHLAFGFIDMRKGVEGSICWFRGPCARIPFSGHIFGEGLIAGM